MKARNIIKQKYLVENKNKTCMYKLAFMDKYFSTG